MSTAALAKTEDFPDRLPPMLIKELRQGMRAKTFVGIFLGLQAFLALLILVTGAATGSDRAGSVISGIIFFTFSLAVLVIQPMRGLSAVSSEIQGNTLDMMVLTRLSAWRILLGKWSSLVAQSALLLVTILPYLILRYFFGGMNLLGETVAIALIFITSMGLTAVTVGLSASSSKVLRTLLVICGAVGMFVVLTGLLFGLGRTGHFHLSIDRFDKEAWIGIAAYIGFAAYLGGSVLSLGASLIAPAAENHATVRRLVCVGGLALVWLLTLFYPPHPDGMAVMVAMVLAPAILIALSEHARLVPTVWKLFARGGVLGRIAGFLLCPGWASGLLFTGVATTLGALIVATSRQEATYESVSLETLTALLSILGSFLLAGLLVTFIRDPESERLGLFLLLVVALGVLAFSIGGITEGMSRNEILYFFAWNPFIWWFMSASYRFDDELAFQLAWCGNLLFFGGYLVLAIVWLRKQRDVFAEANRLVAEESGETVGTEAAQP